MAKYTNMGYDINKIVIFHKGQNVHIPSDLDLNPYCYIGNSRFICTDVGSGAMKKAAFAKKEEQTTVFYTLCKHGKLSMMSPVKWHHLTDSQKKWFEEFCDIP